MDANRNLDSNYKKLDSSQLSENQKKLSEELWIKYYIMNWYENSWFTISITNIDIGKIDNYSIDELRSIFEWKIHEIEYKWTFKNYMNLTNNLDLKKIYHQMM